MYIFNSFRLGGHGYLYNLYTITGSTFAPTDWVVPTYAQYTTLLTNLGGNSVAGGKMKETGLIHWVSPNTGADNSSNFTAYGSSYRLNNGSFGGLGLFSYLGTSTLFNSTQSYMIKLNTSDAQADVQAPVFKTGVSVRLLYTGGTAPTTLTDYDGNIYDVIEISGQYWTKQNWKCTKLNDGTPLTKVTGSVAWAALTSEGYCPFNDDDRNV